MKNRNGYTILEMVVLSLVVGVFAIVSINRVSYAFDNGETITVEENAFMIIEKQAKLYGENNLKLFDEKQEYYMDVNDLVEAKYLLAEEDNKVLGCEDLLERKIKISYDGENVTASLLNKE